MLMYKQRARARAVLGSVGNSIKNKIAQRIAALLFVAALPAIALATVTMGTVTLNSAATATVAPSATVAVAASVTTTNSEDWESTAYRIGTTGNFTCVNTGDHSSSGTNTESFNVTAPSTPGTYTVEVRAYGGSIGNNANCSTSGFGNSMIASKILTNALTVAAADTVAPTVTINQAAGQVDPASASPINFTVVFSESVSDFATGDVTLSGTAGATTATVTGSGTTYNVAVSGMTTSGTVIASIGAGKATDAAGNANTASTATDNTVTYSAAPVCPTYTPVAGNVIANPSFETGFVQGNVPSNTNSNSWSTDSFGTSNATFSIVPGHTGCNAAQISVSTYSGSQDNKWTFTSIPVTAGQYYTFSFWYKASTSTEADIFFTGSPAFQWLSNLPAAADWTKFETSFLIPTGVTSLTIGHTLVGAGTIASDDYSLVPGTAPVFPSGVVTLTFDDGWKSIYTNAIPKLDAKGLKSTQYITVDPVITNHAAYNNSNGTNDFMVLADLISMANNGHEIASHTRLHCDLVQMVAGPSAECPTSTLTNEVTGSRTDLKAASSSWPVSNIAYPYGQYNDSVIAAAQAAGYLGARSVDQGYNFTNTDKFKLKIQYVNNSTSVATIQGWIDYAITNKLWLILMFHRVENSSASCVTDADGNPLTPDVADADCTTTAVVEGVANYLATKPAGTVRTVNQMLTNADTVAPVLTVPATTYVVATSSTSIMAQVSYTVTATDNVNPNPTIICSPASGSMFALGSTTVSCAAGDGTSTSTASFVVGVRAPAAPNGAPTATAQSVSLDKNTSKAITLAGTDLENNTLTYATSSNPAHGSLSGSGASLTYTPATDYVGSDSFNFVVNDGTSTSTSATVTITVNEPASTPAPTPVSSGGGNGSGGGGGGVVLGLIGQVTQNGGSVLGASTQLLTDQQINAILDLLRSFNADQSVIDNVSKSLRGQSTGGSSVGFIFSKTLQLGSTGNDVTELQKALTSLGFYSGPITGYFGPLTKAAVIKFQAAKGLAQVGIVGPQTRAALNTR